MKIWTDGSCWLNDGTGPGGWGWHDSSGRSSYGGAAPTTNNRMELTAILEALRAIQTTDDVTIFSDSQYCTRGLNEWSKTWKRRGWIRGHQLIPNHDLWQALDHARNRARVRFVWVRGHNGDVGNEKADRLADMGRRQVMY